MRALIWITASESSSSCYWQLMLRVTLEIWIYVTLISDNLAWAEKGTWTHLWSHNLRRKLLRCIKVCLSQSSSCLGIVYLYLDLDSGNPAYHVCSPVYLKFNLLHKLRLQCLSQLFNHLRRFSRFSCCKTMSPVFLGFCSSCMFSFITCELYLSIRETGWWF